MKLGSYWLSPFMAVRSFYIISGFYMAMVIARTYSKLPNGPSRFYLNRAVRLYPVYLVVLVGAVVLQLTGHFSTPIEYLWSGSKAYSGVAPWSYTATSFVNDLLLVSAPLQLMVYGSSLRPPLSTDMLILPAYTVGVEVLFYAIAPFIVMRGWRVLTILFLFSLGLHIAPLFMGLPWRPFQYDFFPGVLVFFVAGVIAYRISTVLMDRISNPRPRPAKLSTLGMRGAWLMAAYVFIIAFVLATRLFLPWQQSGTNNIQCLIFYSAISIITPIIFYKTSRSKIDGFLGDLSYPLYVVHFPVILWAGDAAISDKSTRNIVVIGVVGVLTVLLTILIERPFQAIRARNRRPGLQAGASEARGLPGATPEVVSAASTTFRSNV